MAEKNLIKAYTNATSEKRIDMIIKNYTEFIGIVDGYTDGLCYMIESDKDSNRRQAMGDLGVRIQSGGMPGDPTAKQAISHTMLRDAIINCDFSDGILDGVDYPGRYVTDAYILKDMRKDFALFNSQMEIFGPEKALFLKYIKKEATIGTLAEERGLSYDTVQQKIAKMKKRLKKQVAGFMEGKMEYIA